MAIADALAKMHGGKLEAESEGGDAAQDSRSDYNWHVRLNPRRNLRQQATLARGNDRSYRRRFGRYVTASKDCV